MKPSNSSSPRFLNEFDTVDTLAIRNISEKRKLQQHLGQLDKQLHSNLVRMESEILSIRLENCETSPSLQRKVKPKESKGKSKTKKLNQSRGETQKSPKMMEANPGLSPNQATQNLSMYSPLPKITTSSYLTAKKEQYGEIQENVPRLLNKSASLETISELGRNQLHAEQRVLMSLQRPRSKLDMQASLGSTNSRPPTPQANHLLKPLKPKDRQRRASSYGLLAPMPSEYLDKGRLHRAFSAPDVTDTTTMADLGRLRRLPQRQNQSFPGEVNRGETVANGIKICVTSELDSPKLERKTKFMMDMAKSREVGPESRTADFDDVVRRRLQLLENGVPEMEDLQRIRYLRLKDEDKNNKIEDIFDVLHHNIIND